MKININFEYSFLLQEGIIGAKIDENKVSNLIQKIKYLYNKNSSIIHNKLKKVFSEFNLDIECFLFESTNKDSIPEPFLLNIISNDENEIFFEFLIILLMKIIDLKELSKEIIQIESEEYIKIISLYYSISIIKEISDLNLTKILENYSSYSFKQYLIDETKKIDSKYENLGIQELLKIYK